MDARLLVLLLGACSSTQSAEPTRELISDYGGKRYTKPLIFADDGELGVRGRIEENIAEKILEAKVESVQAHLRIAHGSTVDLAKCRELGCDALVRVTIERDGRRTQNYSVRLIDAATGGEVWTLGGSFQGSWYMKHTNIAWRVGTRIGEAMLQNRVVARSG